MKRSLKGLFYLINDVSGAFLKKERVDEHVLVKKLRIVLIFVSVLLAISIILNIYQYLK